MDEIAEDYGHGYRGAANRLEALLARAEKAEARVAEMEDILTAVLERLCIQANDAEELRKSASRVLDKER